MTARQWSTLFIRDAGFKMVKRGDARQGRGPNSQPKGVAAVQNDRSEAAARSRSARHGPAWEATTMPLAGSAGWRREHGQTRPGHSRYRSSCPPLDRVQEWRCKSEVNYASQDIAGEAEEGRRKQRQGERVAAAAAAVRGAGRGGRPGTAAPGRGGEQGVGVHQVPQPAES